MRAIPVNRRVVDDGWAAAIVAKPVVWVDKRNVVAIAQDLTPESTFSLVERLEQILESHSEAANAFLVSKNLIKEGQNFRDVSPRWPT